MLLAAPAKNLDNAPVRLNHTPGYQAVRFTASSTRNYYEQLLR